MDWEARLTHPSEIFVVYLTIPHDIFCERIADAHDDFMDASDYWRFVDLYQQYLGKTTFRHITINGNVAFEEQYDYLRTWVTANNMSGSTIDKLNGIFPAIKK